MHVDDPAHHQRSPVEMEDAASTYAAGGRRGREVGRTGRSAHGTGGRAGGDHAEAPAVEVEVHRVPAAVHDRQRPVRGGAAAGPGRGAGR